jgi:hypothetical protein
LNKNKENKHYNLIRLKEKEIPVSDISSFKLKYKFNFLCISEADLQFASQHVYKIVAFNAELYFDIFLTVLHSRDLFQ